MNDPPRASRCGPPCVVNWRASAPRAVLGHGNRVSHTWAEYTLYSDAAASGELSIRPHELLNTVAHSRHASIGDAKPILVLRARMHVGDLLICAT